MVTYTDIQTIDTKGRVRLSQFGLFVAQQIGVETIDSLSDDEAKAED